MCAQRAPRVAGAIAISFGLLISGCTTNDTQGKARADAPIPETVAPLPSPLPMKNRATYYKENPYRQGGKCERDARGLLVRNEHQKEHLLQKDLFTKAVLLGDSKVLTNLIAEDSALAAKPENSWAVGYAVRMGCYDLADTLVNAGARVINSAEISDSGAGLEHPLPELLETAKIDRFGKYLDVALKQESNKYVVWDSVLHGMCMGPVEAWSVAKDRGLPLLDRHYTERYVNGGFQMPAWLHLATCPHKAMVKTIWKDLGKERPEGALVSVLDFRCVGKGQPVKFAASGKDAADDIYTLRVLGYDPTQVVTYVDSHGQQLRGSALSVLREHECPQEVYEALGTVAPEAANG